MALDTRIPMMGQDVGKQPDERQNFQAKQFELQEAFRKRDAMSRLQSNMGKYDLNTAQGRQSFTSDAFKEDIGLGVDISGHMNSLNQQQQQLQGQREQIEAQALSGLLDEWQNLAAKGPEGVSPQAYQDFTNKYRSAIKSLREQGAITDQDMQSIPATFDPGKVMSYLYSTKAGREIMTSKREAMTAQSTEQHQRTQEEIERERLAFLKQGGSNPKSQAYADWKRANPNATPEDEARFLQGLQPPRSSNAIATQKFIEEHPDATAEDISTFAASMKAQGSAANYWEGSGKGAQQLQSLNTAVNHLDTATELVDALKNGSIPLINRAAQKWAKETGSPAPTNLETAAQIIGAEMVKAVVAGGGGVTEREEAQKAFATARSPEQLKGAIKTATELMRGQATSARQQYTTNTKKSDDDFYKHFEPRAKGILFGAEKVETDSKGPNKGDVEEGYEFLGGDPADQKNWKKK